MASTATPLNTMSRSPGFHVQEPLDQIQVWYHKYKYVYILCSHSFSCSDLDPLLIYIFVCFFVCLLNRLSIFRLVDLCVYCFITYMHACIHTYMHTCMHAHTHTYIHTYIDACINYMLCMHACIHTYIFVILDVVVHSCLLLLPHF